MASLHASLHMNSDKLPQFLGGLVPDDDYADTSMVENILKKDAYYAGTYLLCIKYTHK